MKNESEVLNKNKKNIAGMSLSGGRKDKFFFCLLEYYEESERWFLKSMLQVKDEAKMDGDDAIRKWVNDFEVEDLVVDFPLTNPACHGCELDCPGLKDCSVEEVRVIRDRMNMHLSTDQEIFENDPKDYERERAESLEVQPSRDLLEKAPSTHLLSKSFKRRLRKGFLPYWNRPIDLWVWENYYDQLLTMFNNSYDSFGNASLMLLSRFAYLKRHLSRDMELYETFVPLCLIELHRADILTKNTILNLKDIELGVQARLAVVKKIEEDFKIFIYEHDLELIIRNPKAFDSFILALVGQRAVMRKTNKLPGWTRESTESFLVPSFI